MLKRNTNTIRIPPSLKSTNAFQLLVHFIREVIQPAGGKALLVGGAVRDIVLKITPKDLDVEVYGLEPEILDASIRRFFTHTKIEAYPRFGVWQLPRLGLSFSIPRTEAQTGPKHTNVAVTLQPHATPKQASKRRDLTLNSILLDPLSGELRDPYKGMLDIQNKVLRPVSAKHFADDPVRAWRVIQLLGRTCFAPTPRLTAAIQKMSKTQAFSQLSGARIRIELHTLFLKAKKTGPALRYAAQAGMFTYAIPTLQDPAAITKTIRTLDSMAPSESRWTALLSNFSPTHARELRLKLELPKRLVTAQQRTPRMTR